MKSILDILADMEYVIEDADGDLCILKRRCDCEDAPRCDCGWVWEHGAGCNE